MTKDEALYAKHGLTAQPWLQFVASGGPAFERESAQRITQVAQGLGLQPEMLKRMEQAIIKALRQATQWERCASQRSAISIRVWISALSTADTRQPGSDISTCSDGHSGWGFFLLQRPDGELGATDVESTQVIEVYLYQESDRAKREAAAKGTSHPCNLTGVKGE
jgi:hypothetical protein